MSVPKIKTSASKRNMRRSHHALKPKSGSSCPNCGTRKHSHTVCDACGHYKGRQVMAPTQAELSFDESFEPSAES